MTKINEKIQQKADELRSSYADSTAEEIYADARNNHIWALGSNTLEEATEYEIIADALRLIAKEKVQEAN